MMRMEIYPFHLGETMETEDERVGSNTYFYL